MNNLYRMKSINESILLWLVCLIISIMLASCSEDPQTSEPTTPANFDEFVQTLPNWETFSPQLPDADYPIGDTITLPNETIDSVEYNVTSTPYSLSTTPEAMITLSPDLEILWPGSLLQGSGYKGGIGSLAELPIRQRSPLVISINLLYSDNTRTVANPTVATVSQAVGELISGADASGHKAGSSIFYNYSLTHSITQAMLKVGVSANFTTTNVKASLAGNLSNEKRTVTAYFVQNMFTVSMVLPQYPQDLFSNEFTQEILEQEISLGRMGPDNPPVYVSSITYGRILICTFTSTASEQNINATLNAVYNNGAGGGGVQLEATYQQILNNAQIQVVTVGGDAIHALNLIRSNKLGDFFSSDASITTARPLSYTVRNLKNNTIAQVSETTSYNLREYTPVTPVLGDTTGAKYRIKFTRLTPLTLGHSGNAKVTYDFFVFDNAHNQQKVAYSGSIQEITVGVGAVFNNVVTRYVEAHFDGRDEISVPWGFLTDWGGLINRTFLFDNLSGHNPPLVWKFGVIGKEPPLHYDNVFPEMIIQDNHGNKWRFQWEMQRIGSIIE